MALITCPECGKTVSSAATTCPNCGYPIQKEANDVIRIKIDSDPSCPGSMVRIYDSLSGELLDFVHSGSVVVLHSAEPLHINFCGLTKIPMLSTVVSPKNGGKYRAKWGQGLLAPRITSCYSVDYIED